LFEVSTLYRSLHKAALSDLLMSQNYLENIRVQESCRSL